MSLRRIRTVAWFRPALKMASENPHCSRPCRPSIPRWNRGGFPDWVVAHVVFAGRHDVVPGLVAQAPMIPGQVVRGVGVVAPHPGAIVLLPCHQAGAGRSAYRGGTDGIGEPGSAIGELTQMRGAHRDIRVHFHPLRPLLVGLDEQYVGAFVGHVGPDLRLSQGRLVAWKGRDRTKGPVFLNAQETVCTESISRAHPNVMTFPPLQEGKAQGGLLPPKKGNSFRHSSRNNRGPGGVDRSGVSLRAVLIGGCAALFIGVSLPYTNMVIKGGLLAHNHNTRQRCSFSSCSSGSPIP